MDAASQVADAITLTENTGVFNPLSDSEYSGWNPYFEMFSAEDMSGYSEVLSGKIIFVREVSTSATVLPTIFIQVETMEC